VCIHVRSIWGRPKRMDRIADRGDLKGVRRIISKRCMLQYIPVEIFRASFKFFMGDTLRKKKEGGKKG
ncbi:MAG: hypothetical protein ACK559_36435, partial [bacterium]